MPLVPAINEQTTDQAFFILLTLTNPATGDKSYVVNNLEDVTSRGQVFTAYPFSIALPSDKDDENPTVKLTIGNVDRAITEYIRSALEPPTVMIELVLSGSPDTVERRIDFLHLNSVTYTSETVTGTLIPFDFLNLPAIDSIYSGFEFVDLVYQ